MEESSCSNRLQFIGVTSMWVTFCSSLLLGILMIGGVAMFPDGPPFPTSLTIAVRCTFAIFILAFIVWNKCISIADECKREVLDAQLKLYRKSRK